MVYDNAKINGNALVYDNAKINGNALVYDNANFLKGVFNHDKTRSN